MYKALKIISLAFSILTILVDLLLILVAIPDAMENQSLTNGARAQSEFFAMPLILVGGSFSVICLILLASNLVTDLTRFIQKSERQKHNIIIYGLLLLAIAIPHFGALGLIDLMYSGWK